MTQHLGGVQEGGHPLDVDQRLHLLLLAVLEAEVEQFGLMGADEARQFEGGIDVREGVVGLVLSQVVGGGQILQPEARAAGVVGGPLDTVGAQVTGDAHQIHDVPTGVTPLPLTGVGVVEVAVEGVAGELLIKA